jgi:fructan beta-fructosidase
MLLAAIFATMIQGEPYQEPLRPQFHFSARSGWLNDPNGLVYFRGEYHLFFQHNPFGTQWGNMTWGHAVSTDLVHWHQLDDALKPDSLGTVFSGSAIVHERDSSGLGKGIVAFYTAAGGTNDASKGKEFTQCLAHSSDGRHFSKLPLNPVIKHIAGENRDPKVVWHAGSKRWIMALYLDGDQFALLSSTDLKSWTRFQTLSVPGSSECPDLFELPLDGDSKKRKWVFWTGNGRYLAGSFDGAHFNAESSPIASNFGNTGYAAQTFFNDPKGRIVQIAWLNNSNFPGTSWNQQMGFPIKLGLVSTPDGPRLTMEPVEEISRLYDGLVPDAGGHRYPVEGGLMDVSVAFRPKGIVDFLANGHELKYDSDMQTLDVLGKSAHIAPDQNGLVNLRILADRASLEIFGQHGLVYMPMFLLPVDASNGFSILSGQEVISRLEVFRLKSAWSAG